MESKRKTRRYRRFKKATTLLDIDLRRVVEKVRRKYHLSLPSGSSWRRTTTREEDLYIRFAEAKNPEVDPTDDGLVIVHRDGSRIVGIEILNLAEL